MAWGVAWETQFSSRSLSVEYRRFDAQNLMQLRRRRRVLHVDFLFREDIGRSGECRQGRFMEAGQDQLLLPWIGIDVANREDARHIGFKPLCADLQLLALDVQTPFRDRSELRRQAEEHQQVI